MEIKEVTLAEYDDMDAEWEEYGECRLTVQEWLEDCESGMFIDYDGIADVFTDDDMFLGRFSPSERHTLPENASYVIWYNK